MTVIPLAPWQPDAAPLANGMSIAQNVVPRTSESYGPLLAPKAQGPALPGPCQGSLSLENVATLGVANVNADIRMIAGTPTGLYLMKGGDFVWQQIGSGYTMPEGHVWHFAQFKETVIATNGNDPVQVYDLTAGGTASVLSADAPHAVHVAVVKSFVMLGWTFEPVGGLAQYRLWWSALNDPTSWPEPGTSTAQAKQSDYNDFPGSQGAIRGIIPNLPNADVAILFDHGIYTGSYVGPPDVFDFHPVAASRGCNATQSIVQAGPIVYYLGEDGFVAFDGLETVPIGFGKVDRWFFERVNPLYPDRILGAYDSQMRAILWAFASNDSRGGSLDTLLCYVPELQQWSYGKISAEWLTRSVANVAVGTASIAATFDISHRFAPFTGLPLAATITTSEMQPIPGRRAFVSGARPLVDGGSPTIAVAARSNLTVTQVFGPDVSMDRSGVCPQRVDDRFLQGVLKIPAGSAWTHAQGMDVDAVPSGTR